MTGEVLMIVNLGSDDPENVPVRDAATVMLVRDGRSGIEVFMLRRNLNSDFVGGAYVFPGGGVDDSDVAAAIRRFSSGRSDLEASRQLGVTTGGLAFWVAAIRESFEEAGYLLARTPDGSLVDLERANAERFESHREAVDSQRMTMAELCDTETLQLDVGSIHYFSRWVTPLGAPRRYDTRFFLAHAPTNQTPVHDDREVIANLWVRPGEALERHAEGQFELIFPTVRSLEALDTFASADDAVAHASAMGAIEPILPMITEHEGSLRIVLEGDEVYDAMTSRRLS